jgi:enamine deaminase RidA (YjgF/YER057c/UK114 family)
MSTRILQPAEWVRPKGYANGVSASGRLIFVSGQVGWNGQCEFTSDKLAEQVGQTLRNILSVLKEDRADARHLVRLTWFILSREAYYGELREIGAVYREVIGKHFPVMSVVEVSALMEERALVEIEATAVVPDEEDRHGHLATA